MSSSVCQGLQSCLEPRFNEPRVLWLKSATSKPTFSASIDPSPALAGDQSNNRFKTTAIASSNVHHTKNTQNADTGGWSFLQSLTTTTKDPTVNDTVYVHPTVKRSASMLSEKSLEMCTESLGSETGSDISEISDEISLLLLETATSNPPKPCQNSKRMHRSCSFPPPLTSISSAGGGVQMRSHREDGRFVLQAVTLPPPYFHAERSEGRLRLCLFKNSPVTENDEEEEIIGEEEEEIIGEEEEEEVEAEAEAEEEEEEEGYWGEDTEENNGNGGDEIGMAKFPRPGRCKEGGRHKSMQNWEPFWVAT